MLIILFCASRRCRNGSPDSSDTGDNPVLPPCDEECQRFRRYVNNVTWPPHKPRAAIYILTQRSRLGQLARILSAVDLYFNDAFRYPIIIFHEDDLSNSTNRIRSFSRSALFFQLVEFQIPPFLNRSAIPERGCVGHKIGYRHMCRFHSKLVYELAVMRDLEYAWRLDDDSTLLRNVSYDLFAYMRRRNYLYGYHKTDLENFRCLKRLWESVDRYARENDNVTSVFETTKFSAYTRWPRTKIYYNNFEISDLSIWFSDPIPEVYRVHWSTGRYLLLSMGRCAHQDHSRDIVRSGGQNKSLQRYRISTFEALKIVWDFKIKARIHIVTPHHAC